MNGSFDVTTIIFAALALFVVWKLRSVLGTRTGQERRPDQPPTGRRQVESNDNGKVVRMPGAAADRNTTSAVSGQRDEKRWDGLAERGSPVWEGLDKIDTADNGFDAEMFVEGAKGAYEMIVTAFAAGERDTLRGLLAKDVLESFSEAILDRNKRGEHVETTFVSLDKATIEDVQLRGKSAQITVKFNSKLITATYDKDKNLIDGNPDKIDDVSDSWTFARDVGSNDPNWRLVAT